MSTFISSLKQFSNFRVLKASRSDWQVICFPYVGGNANSFLPFANAIYMDAEVMAFTPPGHLGDSSDVIGDLEELAGFCLMKLDSLLKKRVIFLGYSMGAMLAYRLAQKMYQSGRPLPELLIMAASITPEGFANDKKTSELNDEDFISYLDELGGIEPEVKDNPEIMDFFLPILRTEFRMINYNIIKKEPVPVPAAIIYGTEDKLVVRDMDEWKDYFSSRINSYANPGRHMFIKTHLNSFCNTIAAVLSDFNLVTIK